MVITGTGTVFMETSKPVVSSCSVSSFATFPHVTVGKPLYNKSNNNNNNNGCYSLSTYCIPGTMS